MLGPYEYQGNNKENKENKETRKTEEDSLHQGRNLGRYLTPMKINART